jgi:hypothetical protein
MDIILSLLNRCYYACRLVVGKFAVYLCQNCFKVISKMGGPTKIPEGARPMSRHLLASFLEYALAGKVTGEEIRRFCNEEYADAVMAGAIRELQALIPDGMWNDGQGMMVRKGIPADHVDRILEIIRELRSRPEI